MAPPYCIGKQQAPKRGRANHRPQESCHTVATDPGQTDRPLPHHTDGHRDPYQTPPPMCCPSHLHAPPGAGLVHCRNCDDGLGLRRLQAKGDADPRERSTHTRSDRRSNPRQLPQPGKSPADHSPRKADRQRTLHRACVRVVMAEMRPVLLDETDQPPRAATGGAQLQTSGVGQAPTQLRQTPGAALSLEGEWRTSCAVRRGW